MLLSAASATALRVVQERAGIIPAVQQQRWAETRWKEHTNAGACDLVVIKMLQGIGLVLPEMVSGEDWERKENCICCSVLGGHVQQTLSRFLF